MSNRWKWRRVAHPNFATDEGAYPSPFFWRRVGSRKPQPADSTAPIEYQLSLTVRSAH